MEVLWSVEDIELDVMADLSDGGEVSVFSKTYVNDTDAPIQVSEKMEQGISVTDACEIGFTEKINAGYEQSISVGVKLFGVEASAQSNGVYVLEVEPGTELEELPLPDTLSATGYEISHDMSITDAASPSDTTPGSAPAAVTIEIKWEGEPEYDMDAEPGTEFTFSALWDTENYPLGEGAQAPVVTVMLTAPKLMMSLFSMSNLTKGNTYYFDLSDEAGNIGTINPAVPDATLCYVPFTYTGNFQAKKYTSKTSSFDFATCDRFVADYNVSTNVSWNDLNSNGLIFGKTFDSSFLLRSLSASEAQGGIGSTPVDGQNEWDRILYYAGQKGAEWIKNYDGISSWAQDAGYYEDTKTLRGWKGNAKRFFSEKPDTVSGSYGWRPAIEITDTANVSVITLDLNGGAFNGAGEINLVRGGADFIVPDGSGETYLAGDSAPSDVGALYAQWNVMGQPQFDLADGGTYYFDLSGEAGNIGTVNTDLPDSTLHYVPFTYAGTVYAYALKDRSADDTAAKTDSATAAGSTNPDKPLGFVSDHSLFVADYNVGNSVSWDTLNTSNLVFGKPFDTHYTLRSLSGGSNLSGSIVTPDNNEWDQILQKSGSSKIMKVSGHGHRILTLIMHCIVLFVAETVMLPSFSACHLQMFLPP